MDFLTDRGAVGVVAEAKDAQQHELLEIAEGGDMPFSPHWGRYDT